MSEKLFLLDFDGVLVDSLDFYAQVVGVTLDKIGTPIVRSREDYISLFEGNFYDGLKQRGVDLEAFTRVGREIRVKADYGSIKPQPNWKPVLEALSHSHPLMIISSNDSSTIKVMLKRFEWNMYFGEIFGSDYLYSKKEKLITAMQKVSMKPDQTYYVGDTIGDIKEAGEAGVKSVAVSWGWHSREKLVAANPDFMIDKPEELLHLAIL